MKNLQADVQGILDELVESGAERGVQASVYHQGEAVVEAVAGLADPEGGRPITPDTPFYATSTGKGVTATVVHVLVEAGVLAYDTRIAELWPEFAAHGKDKATVRHALTHSTGIPGMPAETTTEDLTDWDKMCAAVAAAKPWWEPGTDIGYHPQSFGYILGEVIRRATGQRISQVLRERLAGPLDVADELFFGVPASELGRLAVLEDAPMPEGASEDFGDMSEIPFFRVVDGYTPAPMAALPDAAFGNRRDVLTADIPAGGTMSARAVARMYMAMMDEVDGVRLVSPERLREVTAVAVSGDDQITGMPASRGLGYEIGLPWFGADFVPSVFGMMGTNGTAAYADTATRTVVAVMKNRGGMGDTSSVQRIGEAVRSSL